MGTRSKVARGRGLAVGRARSAKDATGFLARVLSIFRSTRKGERRQTRFPGRHRCDCCGRGDHPRGQVLRLPLRVVLLPGGVA